MIRYWWNELVYIPWLRWRYDRLMKRLLREANGMAVERGGKHVPFRDMFKSGK